MISFTVLGIYPGTAEITSYNYYKDSDGTLVFRTSDAIVNVPGLGINQASSSREALMTNTLSVVDNGLAVNSVKLYPNPTSNSLSIAVKNELILSVNIYAMNGTEVYSLKKIDQNSIELNNLNLKPGIYHCTVELDSQNITKKIVIQ